MEQLKRNFRKGTSTNIPICSLPVLEEQLSSSEEEESLPESKEWKYDERMLMFGKELVYSPKEIETFLEVTHLENPVYDWRKSTFIGKKSRKNFTYFLKDSIQ